MKTKGLFITFEGVDGSGKTVQSKLLFDYLSSKKQDVILTREPGGTPGAEEIRNLVLMGDENRWFPITESLLYLAARSDHWLRKIMPALENGNIVICDRFQDSTVVYQAMGKGVDINLLNNIYGSFMRGYEPDITFLIDIAPEISIKRSFSRTNNKEIRFENMSIEFHQKVRKCFLGIADKNKRFTVIDGNQSIDEIAKKITEKISTAL